MASFVESATLLLNDKSSADIKRVNAALRQLFATSKQMKNMRINLGITPTAIDRAKKLAAALTKLKLAADGLKGVRISPTISSASINKIRQLNTAMRQLEAQNKRIGPQGFHLTLPTVDTSRLADIRRATAVLIRYAAAMRLARASGGGGLPRIPNPTGVGGGAGAGGGGGRGAGGAGAGAGGGFGGLLGRSLLFPVRVVGNFAAAIAHATSRVVLFSSAFAAVAAALGLARAGVGAAVQAEDARLRLQQAGFTPQQAVGFEALARDIQKKFTQVPASEVLDASVEMLTNMQTAGQSLAAMRQGMERVAANASVLATTFKDSTVASEQTRLLEKAAQLANLQINQGATQKFTDAAIRAIVAGGGDITAQTAVSALQQLGKATVLELSPQALGDLLNFRDEGGLRATAGEREFISDLTRSTLQKDAKTLQVLQGLRLAGGKTDPVLARRFRTDPVNAIFDTIIPKLQKMGVNLDDTSSVAAALQDTFGLVKQGGLDFASFVITARDQIRRDRESRARVNTDPTLALNTLRGSTEHLISAFDTASATLLETVTPAIAATINELASRIGIAGDATSGLDALDQAAGAAATALAQLLGFIDPAKIPPKGSGPQDIVQKWLDNLAGPQRPSEASARVGNIPTPLDTSPKEMKARAAGFKQWIKDFQASVGLKADGVIGNKTREAAAQAISEKLGAVVASAGSQIKDTINSLLGGGTAAPPEPVRFSERMEAGFKFLKEKLSSGATQLVDGLLTTVVSSFKEKFPVMAFTIGLLVEGIKIAANNIGPFAQGLAQATVELTAFVGKFVSIEDIINQVVGTIRTLVDPIDTVAAALGSLGFSLKGVLEKLGIEFVKPGPRTDGPSQTDPFGPRIPEKPASIIDKFLSGMDRSDAEVQANLSSAAQTAIDGVSAGGQRAADAVTQGFDTGGTQAGGAIADAMRGVAPAVGAAIATAIRNAVGNISVSVRAGGAGLDTGRTNTVRGVGGHAVE